MSVNPMPPKSAGKAPVKSIAPTESQSKKGSKRKRSTAAVGLQFRSAIKKVLREVSPDGSIKITEKTLSVLCGISNALIEDIVVCAADLAKKVDKETIGVDDLSTAFELMTSGELRGLCLREIKDATTKPKQQGNK
uniref:Core Histone H2A/H2B/H3 domain-containing protein n=1 Tax=Homalodisca liturata TaxID=320908 RepID=A0A1B6K515_9HEMI